MRRVILIAAVIAGLAAPAGAAPLRSAATSDADLALALTVSNATPNVGDTITFTVTLSNHGPGAAKGVRVTDPLPPGLTFASAAPTKGGYTKSTGVWKVGAVTTSAPQTLLLRATVASPSARTNLATISRSKELDPVPGNNSAGATETPQQADLALTKTVSNPAPNVGDTITFTVTLSNNGPDAATNVQVADPLPAGLTFVSATPSQGTYTSSTGVWTAGTVIGGSPQTLQLQATVASPSTRLNAASIPHADQFDPNTANNSAGAAEAPQQADLAITKSVSDPAPNVGDTISYTVAVFDAGPSPATNVTVHDSLPAGVSLVSASPSQGSYDSTSGVWTIGTVIVGSPQTLTLTATVVSPSPGGNTASVTHADQFDPDTANNSNTTSVDPLQADLALVKTVSDPTPNVGDTITFTVTLLDGGPATATDVQVADPLPAGLSFVSATPSQGTYDSTTQVWTVGTSTTSTPQTLQLTATVASPSALTNTASISHSDQFDPATGNNSAGATETPQQADLALTKSVSDATPNVGDTITFNVTLANKGIDAATDVQVNDALPAGLSFMTASPSQGTYDATTGVWTIGTVTTGVAQTLQLTATVASPSALTNTASISRSDQFDPTTSNNSAGATETPQQADLALTKTVSDPTPNVGDAVTFTIAISNSGPNPATSVQVSDLLPPGLSLSSSTSSQGVYNPGTGVWTVGAVAANASPTLQLIATVVSPTAQTNIAAIAHSDQFDPNSGNNAAGATETPQQADLALTKTVSDPTPNVGDKITFTVTLTNLGPDTAQGVQVTDLLPAGLKFASAKPSRGTYVRKTGLWRVGAVTETVAQTLQVKATVVSTGAQTNTASISHSDQFDPNTANNAASATETPL